MCHVLNKLHCPSVNYLIQLKFCARIVKINCKTYILVVVDDVGLVCKYVVSLQIVMTERRV